MKDRSMAVGMSLVLRAATGQPGARYQPAKLPEESSISPVGITTHIPQLSRPESDAVLGMLFDHAEPTRFQCRFKWQPNSVAFWDNRCAMHQAMWDCFPQRRYGHRVTICGDRPRLD